MVLVELEVVEAVLVVELVDDDVVSDDDVECVVVLELLVEVVELELDVVDAVEELLDVELDVEDVEWVVELEVLTVEVVLVLVDVVVVVVDVVELEEVVVVVPASYLIPASTNQQSAWALPQSLGCICSTKRLVALLIVRDVLIQTSSSLVPGITATDSTRASVPPIGCLLQAITSCSRSYVIDNRDPSVRVSQRTGSGLRWNAIDVIPEAVICSARAERSGATYFALSSIHAISRTLRRTKSTNSMASPTCNACIGAEP